jgi:hypothetical protein
LFSCPARQVLTGFWPFSRDQFDVSHLFKLLCESIRLGDLARRQLGLWVTTPTSSSSGDLMRRHSAHPARRMNLFTIGNVNSAAYQDCVVELA